LEGANVPMKPLDCGKACPAEHNRDFAQRILLPHGSSSMVKP
jgi:hypothetical protein